jgi:hypothetical protein
MNENVKRVRRREGDILKIDLEDGRHVYGQVAREPLVIFFEGTFTEEMPLESVARLPVLFRLWIANHAITKGRWPVIGCQALEPENAAEPLFYKQDALNGRLSLYHSKFAATGYECPASLKECEGLECAAAWEPEHVIDRLRDYYAGTANRWAESLRIDPSKVP